MATDSETRTIKEFLFANPEHLETAQAVSDAWFKVKETLCRSFLEHLRTELTRKASKKWPDASDLRVECTYDREEKKNSRLWLHRASWKLWTGHDKKVPPNEGCTAVFLQSKWNSGPNRWGWGVHHPLSKSSMTDADKGRCTRLEDGLRNAFDGVGIRNDGWAPHWRSVDDEMANWNALLPTLYREWKDGGGDITDFYVDGMMDIAAKAIPVIDRVDGTG